jgi:hypothetical protein
MHSTYGLSPKEDSCGGCIKQLIDKGHSKSAIFHALCNQTTEIVLTGTYTYQMIKNI